METQDEIKDEIELGRMDPAAGFCILYLLKVTIYFSLAQTHTHTPSHTHTHTHTHIHTLTLTHTHLHTPSK